MHGSTSPSKNGFLPNSSSHRKPASRRATAEAMAGSARSTPVERRSCIVKRVGNQSGSPSRCHEPSGPWQARISAPTPSRGTRARSAATACRGSVRQIAHRLPADGRVRIEQPVDSIHGAILPSLAPLRPQGSDRRLRKL